MYSKDLPHGYDLRDKLNDGEQNGPGWWLPNVEWILNHIEPVPADWLKPSTNGHTKSKGPDLLPKPCNQYRELIMAWRKAMKWRQDMDDALGTMLAVAVSTEQVGDQLFLQIIGDAGSGKTRFCDGMLVSKSCYPLEHLTGFHSGWKTEEGKDYSLISRINRKTLITPEGDVLLGSPRFTEIMSQQRRIFDGTSGASFKNRDEDMRYTGLRTPWIMAGTWALLDTDQSRLGDRFLKVCIGQPDDEEKAAILRRVGFTALRSVLLKSDGAAESQLAPEMAEAYRLTGGYIDWLRANVVELLSALAIDEDRVVLYCSDLGEFTADLRARPSKTTEGHDTKEMPTRLTSQFVRLACCLAVVLNKPTIDDEVLRRVTKVALDTCRGITQSIVDFLYTLPQGTETGVVAFRVYQSDDHTRRLLKFMRRVKIVDLIQPDDEIKKAKPVWRLTQRMRELYEEVHGA